MEPAQAKLHYRPFCFSVKGHVKILRLRQGIWLCPLGEERERRYCPPLQRVEGHTHISESDLSEWPPLGPTNQVPRLPGYYQLTSNNSIHDHRICVGTDTRNHNIDSPWRGSYYSSFSLFLGRSSP
ncbi:PREDICTED: uncharacterized protein LOC103591629 isoform X5 [Galeopterus variegatus]|uniref:Uncharacterized protein LOC103591629 isoform X5 n=1 Tax=Galeopterus variegatus TaxID=482537 RepID=A0ABM0QVE8_GALVR|nr:PREDICTED: uncharacterized protein LOC103591629 isoform X5 [Galeopterus variegatus]XP_008572339.1 PREDICTED: uncharacterized protein LOC103591629 isoform X5 [Galeopterus variegatus]